MFHKACINQSLELFQQAEQLTECTLSLFQLPTLISVAVCFRRHTQQEAKRLSVSTCASQTDTFVLFRCTAGSWTLPLNLSVPAPAEVVCKCHWLQTGIVLNKSFPLNVYGARVQNPLHKYLYPQQFIVDQFERFKLFEIHL